MGPLQSRTCCINQLWQKKNINVMIYLFFVNFRLLQLSSCWIGFCQAIVFFHLYHIYSVLHDCHCLLDVILDRSQGCKCISILTCRNARVICIGSDCLRITNSQIGRSQIFPSYTQKNQCSSQKKTSMNHFFHCKTTVKWPTMYIFLKIDDCFFPDMSLFLPV